MSGETDLISGIIEIGRRIYDKGLAAGTDGNISCRSASGRILITGSGTSLGELEPKDIISVDFGGKVYSGKRKASSELPMHLAAYKLRPDINAVIHAHPPVATGLSVAGLTLDSPVIPEIVMTLGKIPTAPYATPSTEEGARSITGLIVDHDAVLLDHHGAVTVGKTLKEAFYKMEKVEYAAKVILTAKRLGEVIELTAEQISRLRDLL
jgi:L-fuculose-phosphate aldolase